MRYLMILGLLSACSGGEKETALEETGIADTDGDVTIVEEFEPSAGTWKLSGVTYETNTCEIDEVASGEGEDEGTWILAVESVGVYTLSPANFLASFTCTLEGLELFCDPMGFETAPEQGGNATITQTFTMGMVFTDDVSAQGSWGLVKTCAGTDCDNEACEVQGTATVTFDASGA